MIQTNDGEEFSCFSISELFQYLKQQSSNTESSSQNFGKYKIHRIVHSHENSAVLLAYDPDLRRQVVLKIYRSDLSQDQKDVILNEGRALAQIDCSHVARCFAVESLDDCPYLVLEYIAGTALDKLDLPLPSEACLEITRQVALGVQSVHQRGLLHLDLKPSNAILTDDGNVKLIDFGLAQPMSGVLFGLVSGTPAFMAPEVASHEISKIDQRSDVFGVGAILYYLLTGEPPFNGQTPAEMFAAAQKGDVNDPSAVVSSISPRAAEICRKCVAKTPVARFQSVESLQKELEPELGSRRRRWMPLAFVAVLFAVLSYAVWAVLPAEDFVELEDVLTSLMRNQTENLNVRNDFEIRSNDGKLKTLEELRGSDKAVVFEQGSSAILQLKPDIDCYIAVYSVEYEHGNEKLPTVISIPGLNKKTLYYVKAARILNYKVDFEVLTPADKIEYLVVAGRTRIWDEEAVGKSVREPRSKSGQGVSRGATGDDKPFHQSIAVLPYRVVKAAR